MEITQEQARDELNEIELTIERTRKKIASGSMGPIVMVWGVVWMLGYFAMYLFEPRGGEPSQYPHFSLILTIIWMVLIMTGVGTSYFIGAVKSATRSPSSRRMGWFWFFLFIYADLWMVLLWPWNHYQMHAFAAVLVMFAYIVMGLWFDSILLWVGLAVTSLIMVGFYVFLFKPTFWLWMAVLVGGSLAGTGFYIRRAWR
jgi:hypothetical protein